MSFFYDLNKKLNGLRAEDKQITESVAKAAAEVKTPARVTLEESLKQDMKSLMEDGTGGMNFSGSGSLEEKAGYSAKKAAAGKDIGKPGKNFDKIAKSSGGGEKGKRIAGAVLAKLRAAKESIEEASMEMDEGAMKDAMWRDAERMERAKFCEKYGEENGEFWDNICGELDEAGAGGIHGNFPDPMTAKDQQKKMNPPRSLEEEDQDIMEFLRSKLGHAENHPYNKGGQAYNGMEFEGIGGQVAGSIAGTMVGGPVGGAIGGAIGDKMTDEGNAFTGKLAHTQQGGKFKMGNKEYKDTSSLEEGGPTRKHFQQVADLVRHEQDPEMRRKLADHHCSIFAQQNPRFNANMFKAACGVLDECGVYEELVGGQVKLDKNHDGELSAQDFAMLRGEEEVDEGFADMDAWLAQREKEKGTGRFDKRKVSTGTVYTRKPETFDMDDSETDPEATGGAPKRGRGRPAGTKRATGAKHSGRSKLASKGAIAEEGDEMVDEKAEAGKRHFFDKLAPAAKKVAKVVKKVTGKEDDKAEKAGKKVAKDIEHDEGNKAKGDNKAEKAGKKVTKDIEYDDKKDRKEKKADKKEEKVDETTTSGSVATASTSKKSSGMGIGQGIYDSWEREFETLLAESVSVTQEAVMDEHAEDCNAESITITATGDDVAKLKQALMAMGISHDAPAEAPHGEEACHSCGGVPCQCDDMSADAGLPGEIEIEVVEADAPVTANSPDYPTDQECSDDALQYSGGLNKPKSTGQTTIPVLASQEERQFSESKSFLDLYKAFAKIK